MSLIRDNRKYHLLNEDEPPQKKILSDGEILIKELSSKQCNKEIKLHNELARAQNFIKSTEFLPITSFATGCNSLSEFETINNDLNNVEYYKTAGLTTVEIDFLKDYEKGEDVLYLKHKNLSREYVRNELSQIKRKLDEHKTKLSVRISNEEEGNRHQREFAMSVKPNSIETQLYKFVLNNQVKQTKIPHPINELKTIEKDLFPDLKSEPLNIAKIRRKARKLNNRNAKKLFNASDNSGSSSSIPQKNSKWDVQIKEIDKKIKNSQHRMITCQSQNFYTVCDGEIIKLSKDEIEKRNFVEANKRLNIDDIRQISKFKNFDTGEPSNILFLYNLPNSITLEQLKIIFKSFDKYIVKYKVLEKRLRGRAFVYFFDEETAASALNDLLGICVNNRPLIIEFGKKENIIT